MACQAGCSSWDGELEEEEDTEEEEEEEEVESDVCNNSSVLPPQPCPSPPVALADSPLMQTSCPDLSPSGRADDGVSWQWVPELVVIKVLSCLSDVDRCNASLTCTTWRRVFRTPSLWRRRYFVFRGFDALENSDRYCSFLSQFGPHVQHVSVEICRPNINTASIIARGVEMFVTRLNRTPGVRLLSLRVVNADFYSGWQFFSHNRGTVTRCLCSLLKKQSCLREVDLSFCLMDRDEGTRLLDALSYGTRLRPKKYLAHVDLRQFFSPRTRVVSFTRYVKVVGQFTALTSVRTDLRSLNETILDRMTRACAKSIRRIELDFYADESVGDQAIRSECWRGVVQRSPGLAVAVRIHGLCKFQKYISVIVRGLPLSELRVTYLGVENLSDQSLLAGVSSLIVYLANDFHHSLTKLNLQLRPDLPLSADAAVVSLVTRCLMLRDLSVNFAIEANTVIRILDIIYRTRTPSKLGGRKTRFHLNVRGMTPELDRAIRQMTSGGYSDVSAKTMLPVAHSFL